MALGVPGRLRPQIFLTFGTTRVVGHQPNAMATFTPGEIPGTHFQMLSRPQGTWFCRKERLKKSSVTPPGIDPGTVRLVVQHLNHYATPGPGSKCLTVLKLKIIRKMYHLRLSMRVGNPSCFIILWLCSLVVACSTCDSEYCPATCHSIVTVIPETSVNDERAT